MRRRRRLRKRRRGKEEEKETRRMNALNFFFGSKLRVNLRFTSWKFCESVLTNECTPLSFSKSGDEQEGEENDADEKEAAEVEE